MEFGSNVRRKVMSRRLARLQCVIVCGSRGGLRVTSSPTPGACGIVAMIGYIIDDTRQIIPSLGGTDTRVYYL